MILVKNSHKCIKTIFIVDEQAKIVIMALQNVNVLTFIMQVIAVLQIYRFLSYLTVIWNPLGKSATEKNYMGNWLGFFLVVLKDPYGQFGAYSIWWQILSQIAPNMAKCPLLQLRYIHKRDLHTKKTLRCINVSRCTARNSIKIKQEQKMKFLSNPNALFHTEYTKSIYICS